MAEKLYTIILLGQFLLSLVVMWYLLNHNSNEHEKEFSELLKKFELQNYKKFIKNSGCEHIICFINMWENTADNSEFKENEFKTILKLQALKIKDYLILKKWLKNNNLMSAEQVFINLVAKSLKDLQAINFVELKNKLSKEEFNIWTQASKNLPNTSRDYHELIKKLWFEIEEERKWKPWTFGGLFAMSIVVAVLLGVVSMSRISLVHNYVTPSKRGLLSYVTGRYLSPQKCKVAFDWSDPEVVGNTMSFTVKFVQRNGQPYPICNEDNILIEVTQGTHKIACSIELGGLEISEANKAKVQFTVRRAGEYRISILVDMIHIKGSPFIKTFLPGPPDPLKTCFVHHCSTVVGTEDIPTQLFIEPRDKYSNLCIINSQMDPSDDYSVDIVEVTSNRPIPDSVRWECYDLTSRITLVLKFPKEGCYRATVSYRGQTIQNGDFHVIILNKDEAFMVQKNVAKKNKCYEVKLVSLNGERNNKSKKVYCYISPKQLTLKEFMWKFFPKHLITFRLCPSTKFKFQSKKNDMQGEPILVIDDGSQQEVELISPERNIIAATFTQFLLKNIGGSETFRDKQDFFYHEVRKYHQKHFHDKLVVKISRENLLESSFKETKYFGVSDWCKNFEITFIGEEGLDWGGLRREWFELVCSALFDPQNLFFHTFRNDNQGLVHPCSSNKRSPTQKLKYYEFAGKIVGKCLYESALGSSYRQLVKAKFSRSFLAQLIGLSVHYKYFEHDDPDLFVSKIKYILENDIESMGLYFVEEEYDSSGQLVEEVDLIPNGSTIPVTNENKIQYLNALAQYRLSTSVKPEIEHFLKGLNELIPDNLLCIFDENELELLMCGTGSYSISDFKANHAVSGSSYEFRKVLDWFWIAVSNFTEEEMARLLQFTTGCSQLPPGGFSELNPKFHITAAPTFGNLPTAHTCFNQLCLPDYDSYEQFERALRLAINEGSEGFGMV